MSHLWHSLVAIFFWTISAMFVVGIVGSAVVVVLTTIEDAKELRENGRNRSGKPETDSQFIPA